MNTLTLLSILQQSEYDIHKTLDWVKNHQDQAFTPLKPEKFTLKLRFIQFVISLLFFLPLEKRFRLALNFCSIPEFFVRNIFYFRAKIKLRKLQTQGLKTVAIAGSYAKTSTKLILQHALSPQLSSVATDKSINTMLGICQFILQKVQPTHQLVIFELGEFKPGDIQDLMSLIQPDYGILTPIGRQHLERFGSLEKIVEEFKNFSGYFEPKPNQLLTAEENKTWFSNTASYGENSLNQFHFTQASVSTAGTDYTVQLQDAVHQAFLPLLGKHQAKNSLPSFWLAQLLQLDLGLVVKALRSTPFVPHRHEPSFIHDGIVLLDNGYNSNPDSVGASLELLSALPSPQKVVITMGFVELGEQATAAHFELGEQIASVADILGVINTPHAQALIEGFHTAAPGKRAVLGSNPIEVWKSIQPELKPNAIVLFENGYQEQYS